MKKVNLFLLCFAFFVSCKSYTNPEVADFDPLSNLEFKNDTIEYSVDLSNAVLEGIRIPSAKQEKNNYFKFSFNLKNTLSTNQEFYYKIYYQNTSYKASDDLAHENFYGSWESVSDTFKITSQVEVGNTINWVDSFNIVGNPRDEKIFYGAPLEELEITEDKIQAKMAMIKTNKDWFADIKKKAAESNTPVNTQLFKDALWILNNDRNNGQVNHRWKRNPRMGNYKFMLVVTTKQGLKNIPSELRNISRVNSDNKFTDPFDYFEKHSANGDFVVVNSNKVLKTKATLNPSVGVYINKSKLENYNSDFSNSNEFCGPSQILFKNAHFEQFFHNINKKLSYNNIPVVSDVIGENYSRNEYEDNKQKFSQSTQRIKDNISISECPCKTVKSYPEKNLIELRNPGFENSKKLRKENVGIRSRIGFTYGKIRYKIKFPELINKENVWNGITNAAWLIYQDDHEWNQRRICPGTGYIKETDFGKNEVRVPIINYSEIDFEIVKESVYWNTGYDRKIPMPKEKYDAASTDDIIVTCTNFDQGCREPKNMDIGVHTSSFQGIEYHLHRWDYWYRAVTHKHPEKDDELFKSDFYYYEIDWQPTQIIWRIGRDPQHMRVVGYMDNTVTSIPNNQMTPVITQEYHLGDWWPSAPFQQDFIPFPQKDIVGYIYEVTVE